jgi:hypothetical protein
MGARAHQAAPAITIAPSSVATGRGWRHPSLMQATGAWKAARWLEIRRPGPTSASNDAKSLAAFTKVRSRGSKGAAREAKVRAGTEIADSAGAERQPRAVRPWEPCKGLPRRPAQASWGGSTAPRLPSWHPRTRRTLRYRPARRTARAREQASGRKTRRPRRSPTFHDPVDTG